MLFTKPNPYWLHQTHNKPNKIFGKFSKQTHTKPILNQAIPNQTKYLEILFGMGLIWFGKDFVWFGMGWFGLVKIQKNPIFFSNQTHGKPNKILPKVNQIFTKPKQTKIFGKVPNQTQCIQNQTKRIQNQSKPNFTKPNQIFTKPIFYQD